MMERDMRTHEPADARLDDTIVAVERREEEARPEQPQSEVVRLFDDGESSELQSRWNDIQSMFVDDPRTAVQQADTLVQDAIDRLGSHFAQARDRLESAWSDGHDDTEELRTALRRYRSFFQRLLSF